MLQIIRRSLVPIPESQNPSHFHPIHLFMLHCVPEWLVWLLSGMLLIWLELSSLEEETQGKAVSAGQASRALSCCWLTRHTFARCAPHLCPCCRVGSAGATEVVWPQNCQGSTQYRPECRLMPLFDELRLLSTLSEFQRGTSSQLCHDRGGRKPSPPHPFCDKHKKLYITIFFSTSYYIYKALLCLHAG